MARLLPRPFVVFGGILSFLAVSWAAVLFLDAWDVGGWGTWFTFDASPHMFHDRYVTFFYAWFDDRSPVEWAQWLSLGSFAILSAWLASEVKGTRHAHLRTFWLLMAVGGMLLVIEDAGSPRHRILELLAIFPFLRPYADLIVPTFELLIYFPALAALPVYAFATYYDAVRALRTVVVFFWIGFVFYAGAAFFSASSGIGWYHPVGSVLLEAFFSDHILGPEIYRYPELGFWLMDTLVEESMELIGAAGLVSAAVAQVHLHRQAPSALQESSPV